MVRGVYVELVEYTPDCLSAAAEAANVSVGGRLFNRSSVVKLVVNRGYTSILEHCKYTFLVECSRVCSHQLVRHRIASYTQLSQRWSEWPVRDVARMLTGVDPREPSEWGIVADDVRSIINTLLCYDEVGDKDCCLELGYECPALLDKITGVLEYGFVAPPGVDKMLWVISTLESIYDYARAREQGLPPEDARYLLPHSVKTRILVTMNARELFEVFLPLRLCRRAHWEIRSVAWKMLEELTRVEPMLWRYAGPRCLRVMQLTGSRCTLNDLLDGRCNVAIEKCPEGIKRDEIPRCIASSIAHS